MSSSDAKQINKRATAIEVEERIVLAQWMIVRGDSTAEIKRTFLGRFDIARTQTLRYLRAARERLRDENGLSEDFTLDDMKAQHYAMAMKIAKDPAEETKDRLAALKHAGNIYGVCAPKKIAQTNAAGDDPSGSLAIEALRELTLEELLILQKAKNRMQELARGRESKQN